MLDWLFMYQLSKYSELRTHGYLMFINRFRIGCNINLVITFPQETKYLYLFY